MKGLVQTADFLRAVLDKDTGIKKNGVLSHIGLFETPFYHKLIGVTDAALNIEPTVLEKAEIIKNGVELFNKLGYETPKVAVIGAVEVVNPKMQATIDAAMLTVMNKRGQIKNCIVDGPLALDNAVSKEAAMHKNIDSEVAGDCDLMITHSIDAGNVLYKSMNFIGGAKVAAVLMGATVPIVLTSRADSKESKFYSIALAAAI
jgi:phosphate butyryltransferase